MVAVGAEETRYGEWSVIRFRSAGHGTANSLSTNFFYGGKSRLDENGDSVPRQLVLTRVSLVERRPDNYEVRSYRCMNLEDRGLARSIDGYISILKRYRETPEAFLLQFL